MFLIVFKVDLILLEICFFNYTISVEQIYIKNINYQTFKKNVKIKLKKL